MLCLGLLAWDSTVCCVSCVCGRTSDDTDLHTWCVLWMYMFSGGCGSHYKMLLSTAFGESFASSWSEIFVFDQMQFCRCFK